MAYAALLICMLCACSAQHVPPDLTVKAIGEEGTEDVTATIGTYSWDYGSGGIEADAPHPLDMKSMATVPGSPEKLELVFKRKAIGYSVHRWTRGAGYDDFDTVETEDNTITLPADGEIYEVVAEYKDGTVHYVFQTDK